MSAEIRAHLAGLFTHALAKVAPQHPAAIVEFDRPKQSSHGDYATNVALQLAKPLGQPPRAIAQALVAALPPSDWVGAAEIAGPGFINLRVNPAAKHATVRSIFSGGREFGRAARPSGQRVIVEFVSANPTGPLHVGHGRQAALGDAIAALLEAQGHTVHREFYYNDAGAQIENLAKSVQARAHELLGVSLPFPEDGYHGEYIREIAQSYLAANRVDVDDPHALEKAKAALDDLDAIRKFAVAELRAEQDRDLKAFGVAFDHYYLESSLYADRRVERAVQGLVDAGKTYEKDGALWLITTDFGDDKDRVMRKSDGGYTYFVPDVAYHVTKWERGFRKAINVQGSDHHGTVARVRAGLQALALGIPQGYPDYVLHKMVTVMKGGAEMKISKRAGSYVTVRDLIDEVGRDAVRFFLASRKAEAEFVFDIDLARSQSEENPVYYVQYAHARIHSVLDQWRASHPGELGGDETKLREADLAPLTSARELDLMSRLGDYPDVVAQAARELSPHLVAFYLRELAGEFHSYYNAERFLVPEASLRIARLALAAAVRQVLANGLALLGVSAPEKM
ncbi:MAG: arginine--tRNA ligase [Burkholderiales bacterium]|jgi:arginyl-tRNA synthetase|nr:arginine--tRNA ligase [Burkholderiales bacterium]